MLIFVQVCRTIDKNLNVFESSIGFGRINESNKACVARKRLKKRAYEEKSV